MSRPPVGALVRAKAASPKTVVLILTARDYDTYLAAILDAGAVGFRVKDEALKGAFSQLQYWLFC